MTTPTSPAVTGLAAFTRALLRVLVALTIIALIAAALYLLALWAYPRLVLPVQQNSSGLAELSSRQADQNGQLQQRVATLSSRLGSLETDRTLKDETIAALQARLDQADKVLEGQSTSLQQLGFLEGNLSAVATQSMGVQFTAEALSADLHGPDSALASLAREVQLIKVMNLVNQARLSLAENNPGLARQDLLAARQMLTNLAPDAAGSTLTSLDLLTTRIDLAIGSLPGYPVLAAGDLDILWQMLEIGLGGMPGAEFVLPAACGEGACSSTAGLLTPLPPGPTPTPPSPTPIPSGASPTSAVGASPTVVATPARTATPTPVR